MGTIRSVAATLLLMAVSFSYPAYADSAGQGSGTSNGGRLEQQTLLIPELAPKAAQRGKDLPLLKVDQCGSTEYYCDDIGSPVCLFDYSENEYWCAPRDVVYCENSDGWDYWCSKGSYCCGTNSCCQ